LDSTGAGYCIFGDEDLKAIIVNDCVMMCEKSGHTREQSDVRFTPQKRTWISAVVMSALCQ
jgi:hypothetical protein